MLNGNIEKVVSHAVEWLEENVKKANTSGVVVGNSGGVDSAVVLALSKKAFPDSTLGVIMPCYSNETDKKHAQKVAEKFEVETEVVDLASTYDEMLSKVKYTDTAPDLALANIKPRLRMTTLYYYAQTLGRLVIGTSNKSELIVGYFTKYGDGGSDLLPLGEMTKYEVWELANYLGVPDEVINKPPTAGLLGSTPDEKEMGFTYEELEKYLKGKKNEISPEIVDKINRLYKANEHKRNLPPAFSVSEIII